MEAISSLFALFIAIYPSLKHGRFKRNIIDLVNTAFTGGLVVKNPLGMQEKQEKWV